MLILKQQTVIPQEVMAIIKESIAPHLCNFFCGSQLKKGLVDMFTLFFAKKISKIKDTFSISGSFNDAPNLVPPAFNASVPVTEDKVSKFINES